MYYNTTNETGNVLKESKNKAETQERMIHYYFKVIGKSTPSKAWHNLFSGTDVPLTSVRRSISNLTEQGKLEKLEEKSLGMYGKSEYNWQIINK